MELRHTRNLLNQKQGETQTNDAAYTKDKQLLDQLEVEIKSLERQLQGLNYEGGEFEELKERRQLLHSQVRDLKRDLDRRSGSRYELQYTDPEPNFDRHKVRGMVGKLFRVCDMQNSMALMMAAGGHVSSINYKLSTIPSLNNKLYLQLYSFVTDDDVTSKKILQKGNLQRRVTLIPINKIKSYPLNPKVIEYAKNTVRSC